MLQINFIEITILHGCSPVNLLYIFRTPFPKNTSGGLLFEISEVFIFVIWFFPKALPEHHLRWKALQQ